MRMIPRSAAAERLFRMLTLVSVGVAAAPVSAQQAPGVIEGVVRSAEGTTLGGVQVVVEGLGAGTVSATDGLFLIPDVAAGVRTVTATLIGYETASRSIEILPGRVVRLEISLSARAVELGGITVLGTRRYGATTSSTGLRMDAPVLDIPQSVLVVSNEFLEDQDANRLDDLLRNVSGVNSFSNYQDVSIRGFRSSDVLYNGTKANAYNFFVSPKMANVERVEILKGPASVLYGSAQPGGVINIVTKAPQGAPSRSVSATMGSFERMGLGADLTGPLTPGGTLLYRLTGHYEDAGSFRRFQASTNWQVAPALTWVIGTQTSVTLKAEIFDDERTGQRDRGIAAPNGDLDILPVGWTANEPGDRAGTNGYTAELGVEHLLPGGWRTDATLRMVSSEYFNQYHEPRGFTTDPATGRLLMRRQFRNQTFARENLAGNVNLTGEVRTGGIGHRILLGVDHQTGDFATDPSNFANNVPSLDVFQPRYGEADPSTYTAPERSFESDSRELGVFGQNLITVSPKLKLLAGFRYDDFSEGSGAGDEREEWSDAALTFRGGAVFQPVPEWSFYGSVSESFIPQLGYTPEDGGPFDPEESRQFEGGVKASLFDDRLSLTGALFQIAKLNVLVGDPDPESDRLLQLGRVESQGVELDVIGSIRPEWSVTANYAFNTVEITEDTDPARVGQSFPNAPRHAAALWSRYDLPSLGLGIGGGLSYVADRETFDDTVLPAYTVMDAALYYRWSRFDAALNVKNLGDSRYFMGGYGQTTLWPGAPRTVSLTLRADLR